MSHMVEQLRKRYEDLYEVYPTDVAYLQELQGNFDVPLPTDFLSIAGFFDGGILSLHSFSYRSAPDILSETIRLREAIDLPRRYLVLGEPPESFLVMNCENGEVIWCDASDANNLGKEPLSVPPEIWKNFGDYLEYIITLEEEERREP